MVGDKRFSKKGTLMTCTSVVTTFENDRLQKMVIFKFLNEKGESRKSSMSEYAWFKNPPPPLS